MAYTGGKILKVNSSEIFVNAKLSVVVIFI
jgi:hypothetical protein